MCHRRHDRKRGTARGLDFGGDASSTPTPTLSPRLHSPMPSRTVSKRATDSVYLHLLYSSVIRWWRLVSKPRTVLDKGRFSLRHIREYLRATAC